MLFAAGMLEDVPVCHAITTRTGRRMWQRVEMASGFIVRSADGRQTTGYWRGLLQDITVN